jgi:hypothetical protein
MIPHIHKFLSLVLSRVRSVYTLIPCFFKVCFDIILQYTYSFFRCCIFCVCGNRSLCLIKTLYTLLYWTYARFTAKVLANETFPKENIALQLFVLPTGQHDPWIRCLGFGTAIKRIAERKEWRFRVRYSTSLLRVSKWVLSRKDWAGLRKKKEKESSSYASQCLWHVCCFQQSWV